MSGYYVPDIAGNNPAYKSSDTLTFFQSPQVVKFPVPVFLTSIVITPTGANSTAWNYGTDYIIGETSDTAGALGRNLDSAFNQILVDKIILQKSLPAGSQYQIIVTYQGFYPPGGILAYDIPNSAADLSPDSYLDLYRRVLASQQSNQKVASTTILPSGTPHVLEWDPNETNSNNLITNEVYSVNTYQGQSAIRPLNAPFFKDSVVVTLVGSTTPLVMDQDYVCRGFSPTRTALSTNSSGVYNLIVINTPYAGQVEFTYHAVGGSVQSSDLNEIIAGLTDVVSYLNATPYLTSDQLPDTLAFSSAVNRITTLEDSMRALLSGNPSYGSTTTGTTVVRTLQTNDTNLHWWNVASLYMIPGSSDIITADSMKLHIEMPDRRLQADVIITADALSANTPFVVTTQNVLYDQGYSPKNNTVPKSIPIPVMFRLIYNQASTYTSGMILQMGTVVPNLTERLSLTDNSNQDSTWLLSTASGNVTPVDGGPFALPNSSSVWAVPQNSSSSNMAIVYPLPMDYLVYVGNLDSGTLSGSAGVKVPNPNTFMDWSTAKKAKIYYTVTTGNTSTMYVAEAPMVLGVANITTLWNGSNTSTIISVTGSTSGLTLTANEASSGATLVVNAVYLGY